MNRIKTTACQMFIAIFVLSFAAAISAQNPSSKPKLPEGMTGSSTKDPRANLPSGLFAAGEASFGLKHVSLVKKPRAFQLGTSDPDDPKVAKVLGSLGVGNVALVPKNQRLVFAQLAFANSDLAFQGDRLFMGNFYGMTIYDISDPAKVKLLTSMVCPGGQGDVSVYKNLMFMSVEMPNGRLDCGTGSFPVAAGQRGAPAAEKDRFRGVRIFDISNIQSPKQVGAVQTCRGSHTHTLVTDPKDKKNVYIYVSGTSFVRPGEELAGCSDGKPEENQKISRFSIDVIKVPVAAPQNAKIVASPRIFGDSKTGKINALTDGGSHQNKGKPSDTDQCHDITVYSEIGLAAGACSGNGILLDIKDPANPKRIESVNDKNYAYWHSATFSNDGKKVVFTDEWGGGMGARCRENDPNVWGANAIFTLENNKLTFENYYKLPSAQGKTENCVAHNGSLIPIPGRDIKVQAWYQGGVSIMDFTDPKKPMEIAYFDRGPIDPDSLIMGGEWSAYWYNGFIYGSEIARGLDVFELKPTKYLSQNEIDAAKSIKVDELNVQNQRMYRHAESLVVAKAYIDQLERSKAITTEQISKLRTEIAKAESSNKEIGNLSELVASLKTQAKKTGEKADSSRLVALAKILE